MGAHCMPSPNPSSLVGVYGAPRGGWQVGALLYYPQLASGVEVQVVLQPFLHVQEADATAGDLCLSRMCQSDAKDPLCPTVDGLCSSTIALLSS